MRRTLAAAAVALAAFSTPASAGFNPWDYVENPLENCMDCFPQIMCVTPHLDCPLHTLIDWPPVP